MLVLLSFIQNVHFFSNFMKFYTHDPHNKRKLLCIQEIEKTLPPPFLTTECVFLITS